MSSRITKQFVICSLIPIYPYFSRSSAFCLPQLALDLRPPSELSIKSAISHVAPLRMAHSHCRRLLLTSPLSPCMMRRIVQAYYFWLDSACFTPLSLRNEVVPRTCSAPEEVPAQHVSHGVQVSVYPLPRVSIDQRCCEVRCVLTASFPPTHLSPT